MYSIIDNFLQKPDHLRLVRYSGALAAITGLFLAVDTINATEQAKFAMAYVQLFWLAILTIVLTSLFSSFIRFVWKKEGEMEKVHDVPMAGAFSMFALIVLLGVILNLWRYMFTLYTNQIANFILNVGIPALFVAGAILISIFMTKRADKIWLLAFFVVDSLIVGLLAAIGGMYIFAALTKFVYFEWFTIVAPSVTALFFGFLSVLAFYRKRSLFKPHILKVK